MSELTQEARKPLRGRMFRRDSARPREKRILLLKTGVAGLVLGDRIIERKLPWEWSLRFIENRKIRLMNGRSAFICPTEAERALLPVLKTSRLLA